VRTLKLTIAYDGTRLIGWQRQAEGESVQGLLEAALSPLEGGPVTVHGAGRTDAGVHALGQVASVQLTCGHDAATIARAMNAQLPVDVRVLSIDEAAPEFHARFSAKSKTYRYLICNAAVMSPFERAFAWHLPERLDLDAMRHASRAFVGTHDFAAFQSAGSGTRGTVRTVYRSEVLTSAEPSILRHQGAPALLVYEICGDGFLRHMVRTIVGTLVEVGRRWRDPETIDAVIRSLRREDAGATAPPQGLFLVGVDYD
jgi:tRNA pseudouridine38-40 synthase